MFNFLCKSILQGRHTVSASANKKLHFLQNSPSLLLYLRYVSSTSNQDSFRVSYLIKSCGFSPESALLASKHVNFETPDKPDSVINLFKNYGFSQTQISNLIRRRPSVLASDPEKTLLPKLDFFLSKGVSSPDLAKILSNYPAVLKRSLEKKIVPSFNLLRNMFQSDEKTIAAIKRFTGILTYDLETLVVPNINLLRENGVPESNIVTLLQYQPRAFMISFDRFEEIVEEVKGMGFNPLRLKFLLAVFALRAMSKPTWERKVKVYKTWGWSEEEIYAAFGRHPWCMMASEDKITAVMDFIINKLGCESSHIVKRPGLISLSFKKRIVPRGSVIQVLLSKGLVTKDFGLPAVFESSELVFMRRFVNCYEEEAPQLLKLYKEKLDLSK